MSPRKWTICFTILGVFFCLGCNQHQNNKAPSVPVSQKKFEKGSYGYDLSFLKENLPGCIELQDEGGKSNLLISPEYQGRVITSTAGGDSSASLGWVNMH